MPRNRLRFSQKPYDVLIIGGGIYGAWIAWDAVLRGLSVALVEKGDFGHATSSNSSRIIHGGLRYLQHGDVRRMRQSFYERAVLMHLAPHLVRPLPFLIPTYGVGLRSKWILRVALMLNGLIGAGQVEGLSRDSAAAMPPARGVPRQECCRLAPGIVREGLTGGVIYYDGQVSSSERLLLSVMMSAIRKGVDASNYLEAIRLLNRNDRVIGVTARDVIRGDEFVIQAKVVVNATGPWIDHLPAGIKGGPVARRRAFAKAFDFVVDRQVNPECAVGFYSSKPVRDPDILLDKGARLLFIIPWHGRSLIGTAYRPSEDNPDGLGVTEEEIQTFLQEINGGYPALQLARQEIRAVFRGLIPAAEFRGDHVRPLRYPQILDLTAEFGLAGLICVTGVKFTEARAVAEKVVDLVFRKLGRVPPKSTTATTPLHGGGMEALGSGKRNPVCGQAIVAGSSIQKAEVLTAIREELAQKLADVVFRRTTVGVIGHPVKDELLACAGIMAEELGWTQERTRAEIDEVKSMLGWSAQVGGSQSVSPQEGVEVRRPGRMG